MLVTTTNDVADHVIVEYKGIVRGLIVRKLSEKRRSVPG